MALLSYIDLSFNYLTSLKSFTCFQSLITLDISNNPLDDKSFIIDGFFPHLKELNASSTKISKLSPLSAIAPNLVSLIMNYCKINTIDDITNFVCNSKSLKYLDIRGNPINFDYYPEIPKNSENEEIKLQEYGSEEQYSSQYGNNEARANYRISILSNFNGIVWLDGIKVSGKNQEIIPPSKINFLDETDIQESANDLPIPIRPNFKQHETKTQDDQNLEDDDENFESPNDEINDISKKENQNLYKQNRYDDNESSTSMFDSFDDSGPYYADFQRQGIDETNPGLFGFVPDGDSAVSDDKLYVAATDGDSEFVYMPIKHRKKDQNQNLNQQPLFTEPPNYADKTGQYMEYKRGGCQFWVSFNNTKDSTIRNTIKYPSPLKPKGYRYPPFRNSPMPRPIPQGSFPFTQKSDRKLPWDQESEQNI
ncbi:Leucine Rich Repeat family protein [Trichomonas vaginalis G3]|uniref:Leucine Rich Repeat family protein n=1 Tax=Trichomonas vaginalis (strain ATCC PRA-98 / G3) TaxID=412133 RepID=A2G2B1_TRIV3|nr:uncharacterized protein TVAGG3_0245800 [Trichomonas vaginalis G3]EAX88706.1 Leucine Rich Repeat family protein [Trichomonas vaginalis G3]KAI5553650.1 axoneme assembly [Trichomonas vaginalis G3]|eukprot:XP_001301636.1 hypothetical protein [Trichomonas vaginalis G3]